MACDICKRNDEPLTTLRDVYQTDEIKQLCPACEKIINRHLGEMREVTHNIFVDLVKRFIATMRKEDNPQ